MDQRLRGKLNSSGGVPIGEIGFLVSDGEFLFNEFFPHNENVTEGDEFSVYIPNLSSE